MDRIHFEISKAKQAILIRKINMVMCAVILAQDPDMAYRAARELFHWLDINGV